MAEFSSIHEKRRLAGLTGEPVEDRTLASVSFGGQEDSKLHLALEFGAAYTRTHT